MNTLDELRSHIAHNTRVSALDNRPFVLTDALTEVIDWQHYIPSLSVHYRIPPHVSSRLQLGRHTKLICILFEIGQVPLVSVFTANDITDDHLPLKHVALQDLANGSPPGIFSVASVEDFLHVQWRYTPAYIHGQTTHPYDSQTVLPILSKTVICVGRTAEVSHILVPKGFVGTKLANSLPSTSFEDGKREGVMCVHLALKIYEDRFLHLGLNEAQAYQLVCPHNAFVGYVAAYQTTPETIPPATNPDLPSSWCKGRIHIFLEYGDENLEQYWCNNPPPALRSVIAGFWSSMYCIAEALDILHVSQGWHGDMKPDNILRFGPKFRLSDLGFAHLENSTNEICDYPARQYSTYSAPETLQNSRYQHRHMAQGSDIWAFGCVLSLAATWVVFGKAGIEQYRNLRLEETRQLTKGNATFDSSNSQNDVESSRLTIPGDYFHNGSNVLATVSQFHGILRQSTKQSDHITPKVLDVINRGVFVTHSERMTSSQICKELRMALEKSNSVVSGGGS